MKEKISVYFMWIAFALFTMLGIGSLASGSYISSGLLALAAIYCIPPVNSKIKAKAPVKVIIPLAMMFLAIFIAPMSESPKIPPEYEPQTTVSDVNSPSEGNTVINTEETYVTTLPPPDSSPAVTTSASTVLSSSASDTTTASTTVTTTTTTTTVSSAEVIVPEKSISPMEVHFIDVGQGDSTLICCDGHYMLIDAGDNSKGSTVRYYLKKLGIETLDYVIGTHPDADHIGGLDVIIDNFDCKTILMPDVSSDTATYRDVIDAIKWTSNKITLPIVGTVYTLGDASFEILSPVHYNYGDDKNNYSIAIMLTHGDKRFILTGDCETEAEQDILNSGTNLKADVYKAGHHGSNTSTSEDFISAIKPASVVISCGEGNKYGHPHKVTLDKIKKVGADVYRTDEQGTIIATSDGKTIRWNTNGTGTFTPGVYAMDDEPAATTTTTTTVVTAEVPQEGYSYVLNTNSHKFHYPDCSSVSKMSEKNKAYSSKTREQIIADGYEPCKVCNP